jgi:DNA-binding XRE family transcriptional regulator
MLMSQRKHNCKEINMKQNAKEVNKAVAANLKQLRKAAGYRSASAFARTHNIPQQSYLNHESGKRGLDLATLLYYAELLNVSHIEILGDAVMLVRNINREK